MLAAAPAFAQSRTIEVTEGPIFLSSVDDMMSAWSACSDAVRNHDLKVDRSALEKQGWHWAPITVDGKPIQSGAFAKDGVKALIDVTDNACGVSGIFDNPALRAALQGRLEAEFSQVAQARHTSPKFWVTNQEPHFGAGGMVSLLSSRKDNNYAAHVSRDLKDATPVGILVADAAGGN